MFPRKKILLWTLAVVVWFFLHSLLLLSVLTGMPGFQEKETSISPRDVTRNGMAESMGRREDIQIETPRQPNLFSGGGGSPQRPNFDNLQFNSLDKTSNDPTKYIIGPDKMARLQHNLKVIMENHWRPDESYYGFNITRSEEIPVDRHIPDNRPKQCKDIKYDYSKLPTVSIVTPVHNEALSTLVRHVFAILLRTPNHLLKDIILVDDNSTFTYLGTDLDNYFTILDPRIRILRNNGREGLVVSRLHGAAAAKGNVLVFLDAHMEVGPGWSEPLLDRLNSQSAVVVQPDIPGINGNTFRYETGGRVMFRGGFGWDMRYAWYFIPPYVHQLRTSDIDPIPTPVLAGGAIAVKKAYFDSIGQFDPGLQIWGGEQFDLSFRVWTSGGRAETIPCSKVGHVFKSNSYSYGPNGKSYILAKNLLRVAEIWMDDYKDFAYATVRYLNRGTPNFTTEELNSIEERRQLKRKLKCKDFTWYLKHIMPEVKVPPRTARWFGEITNTKTKGCFFVMDDGYIGVTNLCYKFRIIPENTFMIDKWGRMMYEHMCVEYDHVSLNLKLKECPCLDEQLSKWEVDTRGHLIYSSPGGKVCATHVTSVTNVHRGQQMVQALPCRHDSDFQRWHFMYYLVF